MCRTSTSTATTSPNERLRLVARMNHPLFPEPVSDVAQFTGLPTSTLYRWKQRASSSMRPHTSGPNPQRGHLLSLETEVTSLRLQVQELRARCAELETLSASSLRLDKDLVCRMIILLAVLPIGVRDIHRFLCSFLPPSLAPSLGFVSGWLTICGRRAGQLLAQARVEVQGQVECLLLDEVYLSDLPTLVAMEPHSMAVLEVETVTMRDSQHWECLLVDFPSLKRAVSDGASGIMCACSNRHICHQLDNFHEFRYLGDRIENSEKAAYKSMEDELYCLRMLTAGTTPGQSFNYWLNRLHEVRTRLDEQIKLNEKEVKALLLLRRAYRPVLADGRPRSIASGQALISRAIALFDEDHTRSYNSIPREHLSRFRDHYTVYLKAFWDIPARPKRGSRFSARELIEMAGQLIHFEERLQSDRWRQYADWKAACRKAKAIRRALLDNCLNVGEVIVMIRKQRAHPERSSSVLEAFNGILRDLQHCSRHPSRAQILLATMAYNLRVRGPDHPRGAGTAFSRLGISFAPAGVSLPELLSPVERLVA